MKPSAKPPRRYMLDTHTVNQLVRRHPVVARHVTEITTNALCISAITGAELMFGLARVPDATRLKQAIAELLRRVDVLPWDEAAMNRYGKMRADMEKEGKTLGPFDMLIAAHALQADCTLITNDAAFGCVAGLAVEDWTWE